MRVRLEGQPLAILQSLLDRPGELVTREDLRKKLWLEDTFVDFYHSLNAAVKRLRATLNDSSDQPHYIETLHDGDIASLHPWTRRVSKSAL